MDKNALIELTNKLYRLTLLFPKKEPLRYKIREVADEILYNFVNLQALNSPNPGSYAVEPTSSQKETIFLIEKDLGILNAYFEVAKWQNWINYFDVLELQEEYAKIKSNLAKEIAAIEKPVLTGLVPQKPASLAPMVKDSSLEARDTVEAANERELETRKEKIIKVLKRVERIQVGEINKLFPQVSKRTIRRDVQKLLKQGIIERIGEKNNTFYKIKV